MRVQDEKFLNYLNYFSWGAIAVGIVAAVVLGFTVGTFGLSAFAFGSVLTSAAVATVCLGGMGYRLATDGMDMFSSGAWGVSMLMVGSVVGNLLGNFVFPGLGTGFGSLIGSLLGAGFGFGTAYGAHKARDARNLQLARWANDQDAVAALLESSDSTGSVLQQLGIHEVTIPLRAADASDQPLALDKESPDEPSNLVDDRPKFGK